MFALRRFAFPAFALLMLALPFLPVPDCCPHVGPSKGPLRRLDTRAERERSLVTGGGPHGHINRRRALSDIRRLPEIRDHPQAAQ